MVSCNFQNLCTRYFPELLVSVRRVGGGQGGEKVSWGRTWCQHQAVKATVWSSPHEGGRINEDTCCDDRLCICVDRDRCRSPLSSCLRTDPSSLALDVFIHPVACCCFWLAEYKTFFQNISCWTPNVWLRWKFWVFEEVIAALITLKIWYGKYK